MSRRYGTSLLLMLVIALFSQVVMAQQEKKHKANQSETENWLSQHIVAWDDSKKLVVEVNDCTMKVKTANRASVINFNGVLFPVEIIAKGKSQDPYIRLRVKDRYSGDYGMMKECSSENAWCKKNIGKWTPLSYIDYRISNVVHYIGRDEDLNVDKAEILRDALEHYARLCNASEYNYYF